MGVEMQERAIRRCSVPNIKPSDSRAVEALLTFNCNRTGKIAIIPVTRK